MSTASRENAAYQVQFADGKDVSVMVVSATEIEWIQKALRERTRLEVNKRKVVLNTMALKVIVVPPGDMDIARKYNPKSVNTFNILDACKSAICRVFALNNEKVSDEAESFAYWCVHQDAVSSPDHLNARLIERYIDYTFGM